MTTQATLEQRLRAAGVGPDMEPVDAWRQLRAVEGELTTILDLYQLVAHERGVTAQELPAEDRHALARSVMPEIWPGWQPTSGSDRTGELLEVAAYDPTWPDRYMVWRDVLASALGATALRIDHVGSTAVPGLAAKPIIDVQVSVADLADEDNYVPALESIGLQLRSRDDLHRYFRPFPDRPREVHVHVCTVGSAWETEHLLFRDYLRAHPDARDEYARAKRDAVVQWADDGWAYTDAKTEVVLEILSRAPNE